MYETFDELFQDAKRVADSQKFMLTKQTKKQTIKDYGSEGWCKIGQVRNATLKCNRAKHSIAKNKGVRKGNSIKVTTSGDLIDCQFRLNVNAEKTRKGYTISRTSTLIHTGHDKLTNKEFSSWAGSRRLSPKQKQKALPMLKSGISPKDTRNYLKTVGNEMGGPMKATLKDFHNLKREAQGEIACKSVAEKNLKRLETFIGGVKQLGCTVNFVMDNQESDIESVIIQTPDMLQAAEKFGDFLLLDGTYNLTDMEWPVYIIMVVMNDLSSEVVCIALVKNETSEVLEAFLKQFCNGISTKPTVIMTDKDESLRKALKSVYTDCRHFLICLFHVQQAVCKHVKAMAGVSNVKKDRILENVAAIIYAPREDEMMEYYMDLKVYCEQQDCEQFFYSYFTPTWFKIKESWAQCFTNKVRHYDNYTNNRVERFNGLMKNEQRRGNGTVKMKIEKFILYIGKILNDRYSERVVKLHNRVIRNPIIASHSKEIIELAKVYTKPAMKLLNKEYEKFVANSANSANENQAEYQATVDSCTLESCTCSMFNKWAIICQHMFAWRKEQGFTLGLDSGMSERWRIDKTVVASKSEGSIKTTRSPKKPPKKLSDVDKFKMWNQIFNQKVRYIPDEKFPEALTHVTSELVRILQEGGGVAEREENGDGDTGVSQIDSIIEATVPVDECGRVAEREEENGDGDTSVSKVDIEAIKAIVEQLCGGVAKADREEGNGNGDGELEEENRDGDGNCYYNDSYYNDKAMHADLQQDDEDEGGMVMDDGDGRDEDEMQRDMQIDRTELNDGGDGGMGGG